MSEGATCIFGERGELVGCEGIMADRAATPAPAAPIFSLADQP